MYRKRTNYGLKPPLVKYRIDVCSSMSCNLAASCRMPVDDSYSATLNVTSDVTSAHGL